MKEYPKIETLYDRDDKTRKVLVNEVRLDEFTNIKRWHITEKVDGTNVRIGLSPDGEISYGGRTESAQMPVTLLNYLTYTFTIEKMCMAFETRGNLEVVLFGEGYGSKIQKGGGNYRNDVSFRLFDVLVGEWWLEHEAILDVAAKLSIAAVPSLGMIDSFPQSIDDLKSIIGNGGLSVTAQEDKGHGLMAEGIVARTVPMLFTRRKDRLMWKLKVRDF